MIKYKTIATKALYSVKKVIEIRSGLYTENRMDETTKPNAAIYISISGSGFDL